MQHLVSKLNYNFFLFNKIFIFPYINQDKSIRSYYINHQKLPLYRTLTGPCGVLGRAACWDVWPARPVPTSWCTITAKIENQQTAEATIYMNFAMLFHPFLPKIMSNCIKYFLILGQ